MNLIKYKLQSSIDDASTTVGGYKQIVKDEGNDLSVFLGKYLCRGLKSKIETDDSTDTRHFEKV